MKTIKITFLLIAFLSLASKSTYSQNNALNFDGNDDYVAVAGITNPAGSFTVEAWARMETKGWRTVFSKIDNGYYGYTISYDFNNDKMGAGIGTGNSWSSVQSLSGWNLNQWYHVALVYDANADTMYYYQDGVLQGRAAAIPDYSTTPFYIGNDAWTELWDGDIDEVRVWNIARTLNDIQSTMNTELTGNEPGLVNYYNFNQGVPGGNNTGITSLTDNQGAANGTFMNFALNGSTSNFVGSIPLSVQSLQSESLNIYPNPVSDQLFIENLQNRDIINYEILNVQGQVISSGSFSEKVILKTNQFEAGIYLLKLGAGEYLVSKKFLKE